MVAGRTDAGVHALGQVVSYQGPVPRLRSVNALLPDAVSVLSAEVVADGFSARHDAVSRSYHYRVLARPSRMRMRWRSVRTSLQPIAVRTAVTCSRGSRTGSRAIRVSSVVA